MKYIKILSVLLIAFYLFTTVSFAKAPDVLLQDKSIKEQVEFWAEYYGTDSNLILKVIRCESNFKPTAINYHDGGKGKHSKGVLQFQEKTFDYWSSIMGQDLNWDSTFDQIKLANFMWSKGQQQQWSCYKKVL